MKGFLVFLTVALVAVSATPAHSNVKALERGVVTDALELIKCLTNNVGQLQVSVVGVINAVKEFEQLVEVVNDKIEACVALGGDNPTIIDEIKVAECLIEVSASINQDVSNAVDHVVDSVNGIIESAIALEKCF